MKKSCCMVFMGTPEVARIALESLSNHFLIHAVVTRPDRPRGRGLQLSPSPVKALAMEHRLEVLQPASSRDKSFIERLKVLKPDLIIVVAYGGFLVEEIIKIPRLGCINLHSSLLPKYRGAAPLQWALMNGEVETGWTTFYINKGMDSGDVILQKRISIDVEDDAEKLFSRMIPLGMDLLIETIYQVLEGRAPRIKQEGSLACLAPKLRKEDGMIDWQVSAQEIVNRVRGLIPWPVANTLLKWKDKSYELKIFKAALRPEFSGEPGEVLRSARGEFLIGSGMGAIGVKEVQLEGARRMSIQDFLRGHPVPVGTKLG